MWNTSFWIGSLKLNISKLSWPSFPITLESWVTLTAPPSLLICGPLAISPVSLKVLPMFTPVCWIFDVKWFWWFCDLLCGHYFLVSSEFSITQSDESSLKCPNMNTQKWKSSSKQNLGRVDPHLTLCFSWKQHFSLSTRWKPIVLKTHIQSPNYLPIIRNHIQHTICDWMYENHPYRHKKWNSIYCWLLNLLSSTI